MPNLGFAFGHYVCYKKGTTKFSISGSRKEWIPSILPEPSRGNPRTGRNLNANQSSDFFNIEGVFLVIMFFNIAHNVWPCFLKFIIFTISTGLLDFVPEKSNNKMKKFKYES